MNSENGNIYTERTASALPGRQTMAPAGSRSMISRPQMAALCSGLGESRIKGNLKFDNGTKNGEAEKPTEQRQRSSTIASV